MTYDETHAALQQAITDCTQLEYPNSVVTEYVVLVAAQGITDEGEEYHATLSLIPHDIHVPTHRVMGLLAHTTAKYEAHVAKIEWESDE